MISENTNRASGAAISFIVGSLIFIVLVVIVKLSVKVPAIDADRAAERYKDLAEIRAAETAALNNAGWVDQQRGIVRLPIEEAIRLAAQEWKNPAQARADLIARQEKASAPAPVAPAKPNPFE
ncbi:MAG TPA: hypothetical protein VMD57_03270 [Candidatus Baltobacteraceae bacterium]|nr:hypothetical protein [Candidatus Baltobacteraceae bacterium]